MTNKYIWIKNKRYYLYECYDTYKTAIKTAKHYKRKNKSRYFIIKYEHGTMFPTIKYALYLDKTIKLW